jgi:hypothetical protein
MKKRRWQFSLRTMFLFVTLCALWLGWETSIVRERIHAIRWLRAQCWTVVLASDVELSPSPTIPFWRHFLGDEPVWMILTPGECCCGTPGECCCGPFPYSEDFFDADRARLARLFPEARIGTADLAEYL